MSLNGRNLLVAADIWLPYYRIEEQPDGSTKYAGLAYDVLETLSRAMNFTFSLIPSPDKMWGTILPNGSVTGIMGLAHRKEVDFALGPFSVTLDRSHVVDFSAPISMDVFTVFLPRPKLEKDLGNFLLPFSYQVWIGLLLAIMLCIGLGKAGNFYSKYVASEQQRTENPFFTNSLWIFRILTSDVVLELPKTNSGRIFMGTWMIAGGLILIPSYSGVLVSLLTVPKIHVPIDSLQELVEYGKMPWASEYGTALYQAFQESNSGLYKKVADKMNVVPDCQRSQNKIRDEGWAVICDTLTMKIIMKDDFSDDGKCEFYIAKEPIFTVSLSMAFPQKSPLLPKFNKKITALVESGLIGKAIIDSTLNATECLKKPGSELKNVSQILTMEDFLGIFLLLAAGSALGLFTLLLESTFRRIG